MPARARCQPPRPTLLSKVATQIDQAFSELDGEAAAHLLRVVTRQDGVGVELGLLRLQEGEHPADVMAGFSAPSEWQAIGVVTSGVSHQLGDHEAASERRSEDRGSERVRITFLVDRSGEATTVLTRIGAPWASRQVLREPPEGLVADACRRVLGLATPPAAQDLGVWITSRWLDRLLASALDSPGSLATWAAAASLHPLVPAGADLAPSALADLVDQTSADIDWEQLRLLAVRGEGAAPAVTPKVSAWMDAGCFARHLLAAELPIDLMVAELEALLPAQVMVAVREAMRRTPGGWS